MLDSVIFYFFAGIAVASAVLMITRRNAIHSAVFFITTLLATAGIFLQLHAEFLFISQIILYASGITVLFIFVIVLVRQEVPLAKIRLRTQTWIALLVALAVGIEAGAVLWLARRIPGQGLIFPAPKSPDTLHPNMEVVARSLFGPYLLPFEMASVLLLVAMVGAVVMAKKRPDA
jgi:NADH-quinone oxidoreductase subunit J